MCIITNPSQVGLYTNEEGAGSLHGRTVFQVNSPHIKTNNYLPIAFVHGYWQRRTTRMRDP